MFWFQNTQDLADLAQTYDKSFAVNGPKVDIKGWLSGVSISSAQSVSPPWRQTSPSSVLWSASNRELERA